MPLALRSEAGAQRASGAQAWLRTPPNGLIAGLAAAGVAAASASIALAFTSDHLREPGISAALIDWITVPYVLAGLVAWWCRPDSRFGPLMVVAGFANFVTTLSWANTAAPYTVGQALDLLPPVLFLHVFLAYPSGRLEGRLERSIVALGYLAAVGLELTRMLLGEFGSLNLLAVVREPDAANRVRQAQLVLIAALALAGIGALAWRWSRATPALRRLLAPAIVPGGLGLLMIAQLLVSLAFSGPVLETTHRLTFVIIGATPFAFLFGLLRERLAVGPLVLELRGATAPGAVRDALARALHDPSLEIAYWLDDAQEWVTRDGHTVELDADDGRLATKVEREGRLVAALLHDASLLEEPALLEAVSAAAGFALENERLQAELRSSLAELAASRSRIVRASDDERRRLERNLHDGAQQRLLALSVSLGLLESRSKRDPETLELMQAAKRQLAQSLEELRELARGIHPAVLADHGLAVALETTAARSPVPVELTVIPERLPEHVEVAAFYLVCEALANIAKHSHASTASVVVAREGPWAVVRVADDGVGGADAGNGSGLRGLADRVEALAGRFTIESPRGTGTRIRAEIPCT